jgi:hypothetical protein
MVVPPLAARDVQQLARLHACNVRNEMRKNESVCRARRAHGRSVGRVAHRPSSRRGARAPRRGAARGRRRAPRR